jgi:poly(hydroxyalkanoate) depolymerase family esterase
MPVLSSSMNRIQGLRRKFETLLEAARQRQPHFGGATPRPEARLRETMAFGPNPGNLRMFVHVPERLPSMAPLVVALHGCNQTADEYDYGTGWSTLANRFGFAIVYPEQQPTNNPKNCFSWFLPGDISRGHGEALSIRQMVEHAIVTFGLDRQKVFVTGLSAGGAMAAVMLATYPEIFAGGAIIAGLPYGCAGSVQQAFDAMFTEQSHSAQRLGDRVRAASNHIGPWPKISVWHGTADPIVKPSNAENIIRQWISVHGLSAIPAFEELIGDHTRRVWNDANGDPTIEAFFVRGMAHGVPLASTKDEDSCGAAGAFFLDAGISSTHHIADIWRLSEGIAAESRAPAMVAEPYQDRAVVVNGEAAGGCGDLDEAPSIGANAEPERPSFGKVFSRLPPYRAKPLVSPGPIIEAALKAAGLMRSE